MDACERNFHFEMITITCERNIMNEDIWMNVK